MSRPPSGVAGLKHNISISDLWDWGSSDFYRLTTRCSAERTDAVEENAQSEKSMEAWKITPLKTPFLIEKAMKAIKLVAINSCWRKLFQTPHTPPESLQQSQSRKSGKRL